MSDTPSAQDAVYPTPTLRPAHPPSRGSYIVPRPSQPYTRDHAISASGFLREDSITPVPLHRDPAPPASADENGNQGTGDQSAQGSTDGSP